MLNYTKILGILSMLLYHGSAHSYSQKQTFNFHLQNIMIIEMYGNIKKTA